MVEDARFWIVAPRVTLSGVSGLGTLLSGNYIGFEKGKSASKAWSYTALDVPPIITAGQPGRQFVLRADDLGSLGIGAPVYYRRMQAGQVIAYKLTGDGHAVELTIFVNAPYDRYVDPGTRFWNASGVDVSVGAGGVDVQLESLISLIAGGIVFETPSFAMRGVQASADTTFTLFRDRAKAMKEPDPLSARYVLVFDDSLQGLSVGAPVTLLGLPAGEVTAVGLDVHARGVMVQGRVEIVTYPERLISRVGRTRTAESEALMKSAEKRRALFQRLVEEKGLRAQLRTGSLLTGQLYVAFDYFPDAPKAKIVWAQDPPLLPVVASPLPQLEEKITSILAKLEALPYDRIGADVTTALGTLNVTLRDASTALNRVDATLTPALSATLEDVRRIVATADALLTKDVPAALEDLRRPLVTADAVLKNTDATLVGEGAPVQHDLRDTLREVAQAARSLRVLMDYLDRHPEALLRGKAEIKP
jgi:paraquat-inducible protein B